MNQKYGTYGDKDNGYLFYCVQLDSKAQWHDMDQ